jgi:hypothetical protein
MKKPHLKIMKMRGTCNLNWIDYTIGEGLFRLPVMRYLLSEKRWTDKRWFDLVVVTALFLLFLIIKIKRVMISQNTVITSQMSESEKEDRSSMDIVIIESPLSLCGMHKSRRASFNRSLHLCYSPKNEKTSFENEK